MYLYNDNMDGVNDDGNVVQLPTCHGCAKQRLLADGCVFCFDTISSDALRRSQIIVSFAISCHDNINRSTGGLTTDCAMSGQLLILCELHAESGNLPISIDVGQSGTSNADH